MMRTFAMKRSFAAALKLAAFMLAFLTVPSHAFSPMNPARKTTNRPSSALFFKPSSSSPPDSTSSSSAASPTKAAAASISSFGEFSAAASASEAVASRIATLSRKSKRTTTSSSSSTISSPQSISTELPIYQLALAGSVTTALADFVMHPIDCIKTIQQSDLGMDWSILQTATYIHETFGLAGFFHGFCTYAMADAVGGAIKFTVWEMWKKHCTRVPMPFSSSLQESETTMDLTWLGPAMAFVCSSIIIVPGEFLKQQLQMAHYDDLWHTLISVHSTSGMAGFFAGYDGVLLRDIPYTMLELGMYEVFKNYIQTQKRNANGDNVSSAIFPENNNQKDDSVVDQVLAAAMTGAIVAMFTTPMDVIKTKLMVDSYVNYADCLMTTIQNHGLASLYSGGLARLAWIVPFTAIYLPTYDFLKQQLLQRHLAFKEEETMMSTISTTAPVSFATSVTSPLETV